jgi:hypothetical protein
MIIKIKKRSLMFLILAIFMSAPLVYAAASTIRVGFKIELAISNANPVITITNVTTSLGSSQFSVDPTATGNTIILISFNITDANGISNINATKAVVNLTLGGAQWYSNVSDDGGEFSTCKNSSISATVISMNCTVAIPYYVNASGTWMANISIKDLNGGHGYNDSMIFTVNTVSSITLPRTSLNFSNVNLGQQNARAYPHLLLNNTGNDDFGQVNISAAALVGTTAPSEEIAVTNFGVNLTNSSTNLRQTFPSNGIISLKDPETGRNATLLHGHINAFAPSADKGNLSVFVWVNVPSSGLSTQLYNASWNITAVTAP